MNLPVNRPSESPSPSDKQSPESSHLPTQPEISPTGHSQSPVIPDRQQPIPPPSNPRQYRAIGLIRGKYHRSEEQLTRGILLASDGTVIDAVLLGRVISLVKKHLDLEKDHLWVVYPRTRQENDHLHVQIVGVWEPETLSQEPPSADSKLEESEGFESEPSSTTTTEDGYFSVRGEIIYYSQEKETAIVKIKQSPRRESEKPKFFKLKLKGTLPDKPLGHFWDFEVQLQADTLVIQEATDMGLLPAKKRPFRKQGRQRYPGKRGGPKSRSDFRPISKGKKAAGVKPSQNRQLPKPTKKRNKNNEQ